MEFSIKLSNLENRNFRISRETEPNGDLYVKVEVRNDLKNQWDTIEGGVHGMLDMLDAEDINLEIVKIKA